jgi:hypothetical protein
MTASSVVDPIISKHLRPPSQREGVKFLYNCVMGFKGDDQRGAILADDMVAVTNTGTRQDATDYRAALDTCQAVTSFWPITAS